MVKKIIISHNFLLCVFTLSSLLLIPAHIISDNDIGCLESEFECDYNKCLAIQLKCDGNTDCDDRADEKNCSLGKISENIWFNSCFTFAYLFNILSTVTTTKPEACPDGEWRCKNDECILDNFICDNQVDCVDGSDEDDELCRNRN